MQLQKVKAAYCERKGFYESPKNKLRSNLRFQKFGLPILDRERRGWLTSTLLFLLLTFAFAPAHSSSLLEEAFNEGLFNQESSAREDLEIVQEAINTICLDRAPAGLSIDEELACRWPKMISSFFAIYDDIGEHIGSAPSPRIERFAVRSPLSPGDLLASGLSSNLDDIKMIAELYENTEALTPVSKALRRVTQAPEWKLALLRLGVTSRMGVIAKFEAWVRSDTPLGYLSQLTTIDNDAHGRFENLKACLLSRSDIQFQIAGENPGLATNARLLLKEISLTRSVRGQSEAGFLTLFGSEPQTPISLTQYQLRAKALLDALQGPRTLSVETLAARLEDEDSSSVIGMIDACRAFAWSMAYLGLQRERQVELRFACESARATFRQFDVWMTEGNPSALTGPIELHHLSTDPANLRPSELLDLAFGQRIVFLRELQRQIDPNGFLEPASGLLIRQGASLHAELTAAWRSGKRPSPQLCTQDGATAAQPLIEALKAFYAQ